MTDRPSRPDDHRRKWDRDEYEALARERQDADDEKRSGHDDRAGSSSGSFRWKEPAPKRELLKPRDYKVDLDSKLGKSQVITKTTPSSQLGGYFCNVCDCIVKDSINFLDHINGKKHQRNLGMSMKVERSSLDQVKKRFETNKRKMDEKHKEYDFNERIRELKEEEEKQKAMRKEKLKEKKKRKRGDDPATDLGDPNDMSTLMGFSGFGSGAKR